MPVSDLLPPNDFDDGLPHYNPRKDTQMGPIRRHEINSSYKPTPFGRKPTFPWGWAAVGLAAFFVMFLTFVPQARGNATTAPVQQVQVQESKPQISDVVLVIQERFPDVVVERYDGDKLAKIAKVTAEKFNSPMEQETVALYVVKSPERGQFLIFEVNKTGEVIFNWPAGPLNILEGLLREALGTEAKS